MASSTIENYVKQIYLLEQASDSGIAPMGKLAQSLEITPGTATTMVKALADSGLADYEPRVGVKLSPGGRRLALHVLRRHRLVESFLVQVLDLDWAEVHEEAELLEHVISDKVLDRMDAYLNRPQRDPHGDPIPSPDGTVAAVPSRCLHQVGPIGKFRVIRMLDQNPDFLNFADRHHLLPGTVVHVQAGDQGGETLVVVPEGEAPVTLGLAAAAKIQVEAVGGHDFQ